jgi:hypothetical protein
MGNPKNLTHKFPKDLHEGHVKNGKLVLKDNNRGEKQSK